MNGAPDAVLAKDDSIPAEGIARRVDCPSKWPAADWTPTLQGNIHQFNETDCSLTRDAIIHHRPNGAGAVPDGLESPES